MTKKLSVCNAYSCFSAFKVSNSRYLSVFSASDISEGVSESGVKYLLDNVTLSRSFPLGVSNEFAADKAVISVKKGTLLIIVSYEKSE